MTLERAKRILEERGRVKVVTFENADYVKDKEIVTDDWQVIVDLYENSFDCAFTED